LAISETDNDGLSFLIFGRSSCENKKNVDNGRFGALGSFCDLAARGISIEQKKIEFSKTFRTFSTYF
jgi:hypothetical protein